MVKADPEQVRFLYWDKGLSPSEIALTLGRLC